MLVQALLVGLVAAFATFDTALGTSHINRPIVIGPIVGLVLGDLHTGLVIGANLELLFMGAISVGAYIPPDVNTAGTLATAFAITTGSGLETAYALAMPIGLAALGVKNFFYAITPMFLQIADRGAEVGDDGKIKLTYVLIGMVGKTIWTFTLTALAFYFGSDAVTAVLDAVPDFVFDGMGIAACILPAMGFAMLMRMIVNKKLVPFFVLGFALAAYLNLSVLAVAILAVVIAIEKIDLFGDAPAAATAGIAGGDDDDF